MGDDINGLRSSWLHQKINFEVHPICPFAGPGGEHRQCQQIMESASPGLPITPVQSGRNLNVLAVKIIGDDGMDFEPGSFGIGSNVN